MAIHRIPCKCSACEDKFCIRLVIPKAQSEAFAFPCPHCDTVLSGIINLIYSPQPELILNPSEFTVLDIDKENHFDDWKKITISTDLPIHYNCTNMPFTDGGSPFLNSMSIFGNEFMNWKNNLDENVSHIEKNISKLNIIAQHVIQRDFTKINRLLKKWDYIGNNIPDTDTDYWASRILQSVFIPNFNSDEMEKINCDIAAHFTKPPCKELSKELLGNEQYNIFRKKLYEVYIRVIKSYATYSAGLLYLYWPTDSIHNINDYRLYRNDFDIIKTLYQDIFELLAQFSFYFGQYTNLMLGRDRYNFYNNVSSANKFLRGKSVDKLKIFDENHWINDVVLKVSRYWRNSIGHFDASYNAIDGYVYDSKHGKTNYIIFVGQFMESLQNIYIMLYFDEKLSLSTKK